MRWPWTAPEPISDDVETRLRKLERRMTEIELEWNETLDKVLHRLQRQNKRDRDAAEAPGAPNSPQVDTDPRVARQQRKAELYRRFRGGVIGLRR